MTLKAILSYFVLLLVFIAIRGQRSDIFGSDDVLAVHINGTCAGSTNSSNCLGTVSLWQFISPDGILSNRTINIPGNCTLPVGGGAGGQLTLSGDGRFVSLACFGHPAGTALSNAPKIVVAIVRFDGAIDTSSTVWWPGVFPTSAVTDNGTSIWLSGSNGIHYLLVGSVNEAVPVLSNENVTHVSIVNGSQLIASSATRGAVLSLTSNASGERSVLPISSNELSVFIVASGIPEIVGHAAVMEPRGDTGRPSVAGTLWSNSQIPLFSQRTLVAYAFDPGYNILSFVPVANSSAQVLSTVSTPRLTVNSQFDARGVAAVSNRFPKAPFLFQSHSMSIADFMTIAWGTAAYSNDISVYNVTLTIDSQFCYLSPLVQVMATIDPLLFDSSRFAGVSFAPLDLLRSPIVPTNWPTSIPSFVPGSTPTPTASSLISPTASPSQWPPPLLVPEWDLGMQLGEVIYTINSAQEGPSSALLLRVGSAGSAENRGDNYGNLTVARPLFVDVVDLASGNVSSSLPLPAAGGNFSGSGALQRACTLSFSTAFTQLRMSGLSVFASTACYDATAGVDVIPTLPSASYAPARVVARISSIGWVDTSTTLSKMCTNATPNTAILLSDGSGYVVGNMPMQGAADSGCGLRYVPHGNPGPFDLHWFPGSLASAPIAFVYGPTPEVFYPWVAGNEMQQLQSIDVGNPLPETSGANCDQFVRLPLSSRPTRSNAIVVLRLNPYSYGVLAGLLVDRRNGSCPSLWLFQINNVTGVMNETGWLRTPDNRTAIDAVGAEFDVSEIGTGIIVFTKVYIVTAEAVSRPDIPTEAGSALWEWNVSSGAFRLVKESPPSTLWVSADLNTLIPTAWPSASPTPSITATPSPSSLPCAATNISVGLLVNIRVAVPFSILSKVVAAPSALLNYSALCYLRSAIDSAITGAALGLWLVRQNSSSAGAVTEAAFAQIQAAAQSQTLRPLHFTVYNATSVPNLLNGNINCDAMSQTNQRFLKLSLTEDAVKPLSRGLFSKLNVNGTWNFSAVAAAAGVELCTATSFTGSTLAGNRQMQQATTTVSTVVLVIDTLWFVESANIVDDTCSSVGPGAASRLMQIRSVRPSVDVAVAPFAAYSVPFRRELQGARNDTSLSIASLLLNLQSRFALLINASSANVLVSSFENMAQFSVSSALGLPLSSNIGGMAKIISTASCMHAFVAGALDGSDPTNMFATDVASGVVVNSGSTVASVSYSFSPGSIAGIFFGVLVCVSSFCAATFMFIRRRYHAFLKALSTTKQDENIAAVTSSEVDEYSESSGGSQGSSSDDNERDLGGATAEPEREIRTKNDMALMQSAETVTSSGLAVGRAAESVLRAVLPMHTVPAEGSSGLATEQSFYQVVENLHAELISTSLDVDGAVYASSEGAVSPRHTPSVLLPPATDVSVGTANYSLPSATAIVTSHSPRGSASANAILMASRALDMAMTPGLLQSIVLATLASARLVADDADYALAASAGNVEAAMTWVVAHNVSADSVATGPRGPFHLNRDHRSTDTYRTSSAATVGTVSINMRAARRARDEAVRSDGELRTQPSPSLMPTHAQRRVLQEMLATALKTAAELAIELGSNETFAADVDAVSNVVDYPASRTGESNGASMAANNSDIRGTRRQSAPIALADSTGGTVDSTVHSCDEIDARAPQHTIDGISPPASQLPLLPHVRDVSDAVAAARVAGLLDSVRAAALHAGRRALLESFRERAAALYDAAAGPRHKASAKRSKRGRSGNANGTAVVIGSSLKASRRRNSHRASSSKHYRSGVNKRAKTLRGPAMGNVSAAAVAMRYQRPGIAEVRSRHGHQNIVKGSPKPQPQPGLFRFLLWYGGLRLQSVVRFCLCRGASAGDSGYELDSFVQFLAGTANGASFFVENRLLSRSLDGAIEPAAGETSRAPRSGRIYVQPRAAASRGSASAASSGAVATAAATSAGIELQALAVPDAVETGGALRAGRPPRRVSAARPFGATGKSHRGSVLPPPVAAREPRGSVRAAGAGATAATAATAQSGELLLRSVAAYSAMPGAALLSPATISREPEHLVTRGGGEANSAATDGAGGASTSAPSSSSSPVTAAAAPSAVVNRVRGRTVRIRGSLVDLKNSDILTAVAAGRGTSAGLNDANAGCSRGSLGVSRRTLGPRSPVVTRPSTLQLRIRRDVELWSFDDVEDAEHVDNECAPSNLRDLEAWEPEENTGVSNRNTASRDDEEWGDFGEANAVSSSIRSSDSARPRVLPLPIDPAAQAAAARSFSMLKRASGVGAVFSRAQHLRP